MEAKSFVATQERTKGGRGINVMQPKSLPVERHCWLYRPLKNSFILVACKFGISTIRLLRDHLKMFILMSSPSFKSVKYLTSRFSRRSSDAQEHAAGNEHQLTSSFSLWVSFGF